MGQLGYVQGVFLGLLALVVAIAGLARRFAVSYPIVLVIAGLVCSLLPGLPRVPLPPDVVFLIFLPPLLSMAAWQTSWREFRTNLVSISMLAFGLVLFTALGVSLAAHFFMPGFDWRLGFLLGAVVSPTDAVAATSIARTVGMPQTIVDLLEGESLLNDASGLLLLQFGVEMIQSGARPSFTHGLTEFVWLLLGGAGIGLLVGRVVIWADKWVDDGPVEIVLSFLVAYLSYLAGEAIHASGVIAAVVCGLYMSRQTATQFSAAVRLQAEGVWNAAEFFLNGLVFILIGLQLRHVLEGIQGYSLGRLALYGLAFSGVLIALRLMWMFPAARLAYFVRTGLLGQQYDRPKAKQVFLLGWTGMRGVVALAAASSLPYKLNSGAPFPQRDMILFLTFAVILVTLVLQGLLLPPLVRLLGLDGGTDGEEEEQSARKAVIESALEFLHEARSRAGSREAHSFNDLIHVYEHRLHELEPATEEVSEEKQHADLLRHLRIEVLQHERKVLLDMRNSGRIGDAAHRSIERDLDLSENRLV